jgi:flagellar basal-body rod protein FlgC
MDLFGVFAISAAGMSTEQSRLAVAASNLANARTSKGPDGTLYQPLSAVVRTNRGFDSTLASLEGGINAASLPRPVVTSIAQQVVAPRLVYDPGHPDADERGFVSLPGVDPLSTMLDFISVTRSYEANLRAFDITRSLIQKTLEMGSRR